MRLIKNITLLTACTCIGLGTVTFTGSITLAHSTLSEPSVSDVQLQLVRHYLIPDALCAAGVASSSIDEVVIAAADAIEEEWDDLTAAESALRAQQVTVGTLKKQIAAGDADSQALAEFAQAETDLAAAQAAYDTQLAVIDTAFLAQMTSAEQNAFLKIRENQSRGVPMQYMVLDQTEEEWLDLRRALAEIRTSEAPSTEATQTVQGYDANYAVSLAKTHLSSSQAAVKAAYDAMVASLD